MTWSEFARARQQLTEEFVGLLHREHQRAELAKVETTKAAIRKHQAATPPPPQRLESAPEPLVLQKGEIKRGRVY